MFTSGVIVWDVSTNPVSGKTLATCLLCTDFRPRELFHVSRHEQTATHKANLALKATRASLSTEEEVRDSDIPSSASAAQVSEDERYLAHHGLRTLLASLSGADTPQQTDSPPSSPQNPDMPHPSTFPWNTYEATEDTRLMLSPEEEAAREMARELLERWDAESVSSGDGDDERSDGGLESEGVDEPVGGTSFILQT